MPDLPEIKTLQSNNGFTVGQLLYEVAKILPKDGEYGSYDHFGGLTWNQENRSYEVTPVAIVG